MFVGRGGLCHDVDDPLGVACSGGRRLYYTAYGDPICDCPVGRFPFPTPRDDCRPLFTQGDDGGSFSYSFFLNNLNFLFFNRSLPCGRGQVLTLSRSTGQLVCRKDKCARMRNELHRQLLPSIGDSSTCHVLGSRCKPIYGGQKKEPTPSTVLFGFDVFELKSRCYEVPTPFLVAGSKEMEELDLAFPSFGNGRNEIRTKWSSSSFVLMKKYDAIVGDLLLLNPCRLGARNGNNFKCSNPVVQTAVR